jgi:hypothetical protein
MLSPLKIENRAKLISLIITLDSRDDLLYWKN